jgi:hypothetical protein
MKTRPGDPGFGGPLRIAGAATSSSRRQFPGLLRELFGDSSVKRLWIVVSSGEISDALAGDAD